MTSRKELIKKYLDFFKSKQHKIIPSSSLIPSNDPTVLFTTAGMHPLVPFLSGQKHPLGKRLVDVQKCIRTGDIEEVGDTTHHTFFEMLGNWSLGDYWKSESIKYSFEFLTDVLGIEKERLGITCFGGDKRVPQLPIDKESAEIWKSLGIKKERIVFLEGGVFESKKNWWGPAGQTGPCGPDTEIFYYIKDKAPKTFDPEDKNWVEIWNNVFMEYEKVYPQEIKAWQEEGPFTQDEKGEHMGTKIKENAIYEKAKQRNVDTGMGVERTLATINNLQDNYETDSFAPIIKKIESLSGKSYKKNEKAMRIIADHIRSAVFILAENVKPSNAQQGYVLRRLIRRAIRYWRALNQSTTEISAPLAEKIIEIYDDYTELQENSQFIIQEIKAEEEKFNKTLEQGIQEFNKMSKNKSISGKEAFLLFQSYGFPIEITEELAKERKISIDIKGFNEEYKKHQELSRSTSAGMFKSGLADNSEQTTRLHTATHMLNEALREVLGNQVKQRGSNITPERLRFDFNFDRKLTESEIKQIETIVNKKIKDSLEVVRTETSLKQALADGAQGEFGHKYPEKVSVYTIVDKKDKRGFYSKEICTGPHVKNTKDIGKVKIIKEESVSSGVRRIKAIVEN